MATVSGSSPKWLWPTKVIFHIQSPQLHTSWVRLGHGFTPRCWQAADDTIWHHPALPHEPGLSLLGHLSTGRKSRWQGRGRHAGRERDTVPLGSYFQLFRPLYPIYNSNCPHLVGVAVRLQTFWTVRCPKTMATSLAVAAAADKAAAGQTDCLEEIFALVDGCQNWEEHHASLLLHSGEKIGFGSKSSLSVFCRHTQMQQHIHSQTRRKYGVVSLVTGNLCQRKMVPLRDICHGLFKHSLAQGVPQEEDNTVRGLDHG